MSKLIAPYVSIDIETTGLNPDTCQVLEIGAVIDFGPECDKPVDGLPWFHCYLDHERIYGEPYALSMHSTILRRIATREYGYLYLNAENSLLRFSRWLASFGLGGNQPIVAAGKNFAGFDKQFLQRLWGPENLVRFHHRCIDPGMLYWNPATDKVPPDMKTCMERAVLAGEVAHTALEDAMIVVKLIRHALLN